MGFDDYKVVLYRNQPDGWVAEIPGIPGCHAHMPTREAALVELASVFQLIAEEYQEGNRPEPNEHLGRRNRLPHLPVSHYSPKTKVEPAGRPS
jgi:predicted RNase H-like HicB family nuclease